MKPFLAKAALLLLVPWIAAGLIAAPWTTAAIAAATDTVHLTGISKSVTFGTVKKVSSKSIKIKNNGKADASVTVVPPSSPFSVTSGGGSFTLAPKASQKVTIEFAPSAAGTFTSAITIECSNCTDSSQNNIAVNLKGSAKSAAAASPAPTPAPTPSAGANALPFSVNSGPFGESADMPYTSVTICAAGTSNCTTLSQMGMAGTALSEHLVAE
jgi:HYDIN/CFA65/VesB-like, Ig-like domain